MNYRDYTQKWEKVFVGKTFRQGYGGIYHNQRWIQKIIRPIIKGIKQCSVGDSVFLADIGCGSGILGLNVLYSLPEFQHNIFLHSIDINVNQLDGLDEEAKKLKVSGNYQAVNSNLFTIAYPDNFFHGIVGRLFLHHLTLSDNDHFWQFIVDKLKPDGISSIYTVVAPNEAVASFIRTVYEWRAEKVGVEPQGFISTHSYVREKLLEIKGISFKVSEEVRGPLYVSGEASIQEKMGLENQEMAGLERIFDLAPREVKKICKIRKTSKEKTRTHKFYWPCQLIVIRKEK